MTNRIFYKYNSDKLTWHILPDKYAMSELTFCSYSVKINDTIYTENTPEFRVSYQQAREQEKIWEALSDRI